MTTKRAREANTAGASSRRYQSWLWAVLVVNLALVAVLAGAGVEARSLGVWAAGTDYLGDAGGIAMALVAARLGRPSRPGRPARYPRATRYAAVVNAGWLLAITAAVGAGALVRLISGAGEVRGLVSLVVSGLAAVVMGASALLLRAQTPAGTEQQQEEEQQQQQEEDFSLSAIMLDTVADAASAAGVALSGGVIYATGGNYWLDPAAALVVSLAVGYQAGRLLARSTASLRTPKEPQCAGY
jgi:cobalt-zinc-cadmium efflux system protein